MKGFARVLGMLCLALLVAACGGGGGDSSPRAGAASDVLSPLTFLIFPNPQVQADGSFQVDSAAYATSYYAAIDPTNAKDTLAKWKAANGFDSGVGTQVTVVFGDKRDLGYGRRLTVRQNLDGTVAAFVDNYQVTAVLDYGYTTINLDAALVQDTRWRVGTNAIEYSPGPGGTVNFTKFFNFNTTTGARELAADLDGRGQKAMPTICITCHGGRGDALTPPDPGTGNPLFALVRNSASAVLAPPPPLGRGDIQAHMNPLEVDTFDFSTAGGFRRADQEAALKLINQMVLCTYPRAGAVAGPEDNCRRAATFNEWRGTADAVIKNAYGGNGMPNAVFSDTFVPAGWAAQPALYRDVVVPACRGCHLLRGTGNQSDIDFNTLAKFSSYAADIKYHVFDRGNMPLAKIIYDDLYTTNKLDTLATFLQTQGINARDANGAVLRAGRPVADPGPDRVIQQGPAVLSAANSLYASSHAWTIVSGPNGTVPPVNATLTNPNSVQPTFNASVDGTYVLQLISSQGATPSAPVLLQLVVQNALAPAPSATRFVANVKPILQGACVGCHVAGGGPPVFFNNFDRDGINGVDPNDDRWFYAEVRSLINFTYLKNSPLLRKPSGQHHGGGLQPGFNAALAPGGAGRANYDLILNWILNGAPE